MLSMIALLGTMGVIVADEPKKPAATLEGTWTVVSVEHDGKAAQGTDLKKGDKLVVKGDGYRFDAAYKEEGTFKVDAAKTPATIDLTDSRKQASHGIYKLDGNRLTLCFWPGERPAAFKSSPTALLVEFERKK